MTRTAARGVALSTALMLALLSGVVFSTQARAQTTLPGLLYGTAGRLPLSVVGAGVAGSAGVLTAPAWAPALAGAAVTAGAMWAGEKAIKAAWTWATSTSTDFGAPPPPPVGLSGTWSNLAANCSAAGAQLTCDSGARTLTIASAPKVGDPGPWTIDTQSVRPYQSSYLDLRIHYGNGSNITAPNYVACPGGNINTCIRIHGTTTAGSGWTATRTQVVNGGTHQADWATAAPTSPAPTGPAGTTPLTVTPRQQCSGSTSWISGTPTSVTRGGTSAGTIDLPDCPPGTTRTRVETPITRTSDGAAVGEVTSPWTPPAVPAAYPDCATYACTMTLTRTSPDGQTITCREPGECVSYADVVKAWPQTGTAASTVARQAPDGANYQCRFGSYPVAVAECQVVPNAGVGVTAAPAESDARCDWAVTRPWTWPLTAIRCAFVPKPETFTNQVTSVRTEWAASFPGAYLGAMGGVVTGLGTFADNAEGCGGPVMHLDTGMLQGQYKPLDACPGSLMEDAAVGVRLLLTVGLYLGAAALTARILAVSFGLNLGNFGRTD